MMFAGTVLSIESKKIGEESIDAIKISVLYIYNIAATTVLIHVPIDARCAHAPHPVAKCIVP